MGTVSKKLLQGFDTALSRTLAPAIGRLWDIYSLILLRPVMQDFIPWTGVAIRPYTALTIVNDICINNRQFIVELGAGVSTLLIAQLLRNRGEGKLLSIEDSEKWASFMNNELKTRGLNDYCSVLYAPLEPCKHSLNREVLWHQEKIVLESIIDSKIDLLLVDGPKASIFKNKFARFPAVPVLKPYLAESFSIYLDDIRRSGEREIVEKWVKLIDCKVLKSPIKGNFSCLQQGKSYYARP